MADRAKTGNLWLDAWIDAMRPLLPSGSAPESATQPFAPLLTWERMFFGKPAVSPVEDSALGPGSKAGLTELWSEFSQRSFGVIAALGNTSNAGDPLGQALEQSFGVVGDVGGAVEGPALLAEVTAAASKLFVAREAYRAVMFAIWQRAFEELTREAVRRASEGKPVATPAQWLSLSNSVADRVFVEAFNSQAYIDAQRQLSTALADQRRSEMKFVEAFAQYGHFPTRRALDDVSREVNDLRRRLRRLERASRSAPARQKAEVADER